MNPKPSPDDKELNPSGKPPLSEKDFIQKGPPLISMPYWLWIVLIAVLAALIWGFSGWYEEFIYQEKSHDAFLEVTNREFSVFLWQFPSFLPSNIKSKTGYLPGFLRNSENFNPSTAEELVSAPPDLIFLYHTWKRLLALEFIPRAISPKEFEDFLQQLPEWLPINWKNAPSDYVQLVDSKNYSKMENLQTLSESTLPLIIRQALQGWKNYFIEGEMINELQPTFGQVEVFLKRHPDYARNYWRNIDEVYGQKIAGLNYLRGMLNTKPAPDDIVPSDQLSSFLKVALFNAEQAQQNR